MSNVSASFDVSILLSSDWSIDVLLCGDPANECGVLAFDERALGVSETGVSCKWNCDKCVDPFGSMAVEPVFDIEAGSWVTGAS